MLVLTRKVDQSLIIDDQIVIRVVDVRGGKVRLGIEAPRHISIARDDAQHKLAREAQHLLAHEAQLTFQCEVQDESAGEAGDAPGESQTDGAVVEDAYAASY